MKRWIHGFPLFSVTLVMLLGATNAPAQDEPTRPDEAVMQSTERGFRLTPEMARMIGRAMLRNSPELEELNLTSGQELELSEVLARRAMALGHARGEQLQPFLEYFIESMIVYQGKFPPDVTQRFGELATPVMPGVKDLLTGMREDARQILDADQFEESDKRMRRALHDVGRFENKMKRWSEGRAEEGETLEHYAPEDGEPLEEEDSSSPKNRQMRHAEAMARWELSRVGPREWRRFLAGAVYLFKFDETQTAKAEALLSDCQQRAKAVMTDEWERTLRLNRVKYHLRYRLGNVKKAPWLYQLESEHAKALAPIEELGREFREGVLALVTDEQREAVLTHLRERATQHGLPAEAFALIEKQLTEAATRAAPESGPTDDAPAP